jgi:hypothetical protein
MYKRSWESYSRDFSRGTSSRQCAEFDGDEKEKESEQSRYSTYSKSVRYGHGVERKDIKLNHFGWNPRPAYWGPHVRDGRQGCRAENNHIYLHPGLS